MHNHNYKNKQHLPGVDSTGNQPDPGDPSCLMLIQDTNIRLKMQFEFVYSPIFILFAILWLKSFSYYRRNFGFHILVHPDTYLHEQKIIS